MEGQDEMRINMNKFIKGYGYVVGIIFGIGIYRGIELLIEKIDPIVIFQVVTLIISTILMGIVIIMEED